MLAIDSFGNIWPCNRWDSHFDETWTRWKLGNIYEGFIEENQDYFLGTNKIEERCEDCIAKITCTGGCHASNLDTTGEMARIHERTCQLFRIDTKVAIALHDELYAEKCPVFMQNYYPEEWKNNNEEKTNEPANHVPAKN
ncbi:MAG: SPASM domain-containing protein [Planctomycetaceae bacterium]|jgi:uncharacterized protein|nr:SPASM domain-containing protein [Planctomycetaceae bacterium]